MAGLGTKRNLLLRSKYRMRLSEITQPRYFIANQRKLRPKMVLQGQIPQFPLGAELELCLEARRPEGGIPRDTSIYLDPDQVVTGEYVYEVRPIGEVARNHTAWLEALKVANARSLGEVDLLCRGYWSGKELPEGRNHPWEYRAARVVIIKRVGGHGLD